MAIITSVTHPVETGSTGNGEFAINGLPIQVTPSGNTVGEDLTFDGRGLSLALDTPGPGTVQGASVNGGPAQRNIDVEGILQLLTPTGTLKNIKVNGVTATVDNETGVASVNIATASGTINTIVVNGVTGTTLNGVASVSAGTVTGISVNSATPLLPLNGIVSLTGIGRANSVVYEGVTYNANAQGIITLPTAASTSLGNGVKKVVINGNSAVAPDADGLVNLGTVGTVRQVVVNGVTGIANASGVVSLTLPLGNVNSVSVEGGTPILPMNGNIDLAGIGTVKSISFNSTTITPTNGNIALGSIGTLSGVRVNNVNATVINGVAELTIPIGSGTVTGVTVNGGSVQRAVNGVVALTIAPENNVVKQISVGGQLLSPVNGILTLTLPDSGGGTVKSVSFNGNAAVTPNNLGNVSLTGVGTVSGVTVNGGGVVPAVNGVVALQNVGTVSGITVNGGGVLVPVNGRIALTGVGKINRVILNGAEASYSTDGTATLSLATDANSVKTVTLNGGAPIVPVNGNINLTISAGNSNENVVTGVTINGGSSIAPVNGTLALTGIGTVTQLRQNGVVLTPMNGEIAFSTGTVNSVSVNGGAPQPSVNGNVNISVPSAQAGAQSVTINGSAPQIAVNGNIALTGIGTVTGATINGSSVVIPAVGGRLPLTGIGTVQAIVVNGASYSPVNGVVTLPGGDSVGSGNATGGGIRTISINNGEQQGPSDGNVNLLVGTLTGVTVNGTAATVTNGRANLTLGLPTVPVKGVAIDGSVISPDGQGVVNLSYAGLVKSVTFQGETQNPSASGSLSLPSTVGTVKGVSINGGSVIAPVNGVIALTLASGQTTGIQSLVVNGSVVTANNGVATFATPQGTVTGITLNGSPVQAPVNGVVALSITQANGGVQSISLNGTPVAANVSTGNVSLANIVTSVTVNGGGAVVPNSAGVLALTTPTNFVKTVSINGGTPLVPSNTTGNVNIALPTGGTTGVQGVTVNNGSPIYPTNGIVNIDFVAATSSVKTVTVNGVTGAPDTNGAINITLPASSGNVKSVSINGGSKYLADANTGNVDITAPFGAGTVTGIQVNGSSVQTPNSSGTLILTNIGTVSGVTINGSSTVQTPVAGKLNLTGIGTVSSIVANGNTYAPVGNSNVLNLGSLGTVNSVTINGGAQITPSNGNLALTGIGSVTGATVNGGAIISPLNGVLNLTVPTSSGGPGGIQAISVNNGSPMYPQGGVVNLDIQAGSGTVTGVTVNGGTVNQAVNGLVSLTGVGTVTGARINGGAAIAAVNGVIPLTGVGTVSGITFNGGLTQTATNGVVALTYAAPTDTVKSVIVNGGSPQTPVNGVLNLTVATTGGGSGSSGVKSVTVNGGAAIAPDVNGLLALTGIGTIKTLSINGGTMVTPDANGLIQITTGTVKSVKVNGANYFPDPTNGQIDLGVLAASGGGSSSYNLPVATATVLGGVKAGANVTIATDGTLSVVASTGTTLPVASATALGGVKIGANLTIAGDGTLSTEKYSLPIATNSILGGVRNGGNVTVDANGLMQANQTVGFESIIGSPFDNLALGTALRAVKLTAQPVTYQELVNLRVNGMLSPSNPYLLTDYQMTHVIPGSNDVNTGPIEPLYLTATGPSTLAAIGFSQTFPDDIIYYSLDNTGYLPGATRGYVYRRIDTIYGNDLEIDFRTVKFRRWMEVFPKAEFYGNTSGYTSAVDNGNQFADFKMFGYYFKCRNNVWSSFERTRLGTNDNVSIFDNINFVSHDDDSRVLNTRVINSKILNTTIHGGTWFREITLNRSIINNLKAPRYQFVNFFRGTLTDSTINDKMVDGNEVDFSVIHSTLSNEPLAQKTYINSSEYKTGTGGPTVETNLTSNSTTSVPSVSAVVSGLSGKADLVAGKVPTSQLTNATTSTFGIIRPTTGLRLTPSGNLRTTSVDYSSEVISTYDGNTELSLSPGQTYAIKGYTGITLVDPGTLSTQIQGLILAVRNIGSIVTIISRPSNDGSPNIRVVALQPGGLVWLRATATSYEIILLLNPIDYINATETLGSAVRGGTYDVNGEFQGAQPDGSALGMRFKYGQARYEFMPGDNGLPVWVRSQVG